MKLTSTLSPRQFVRKLNSLLKGCPLVNDRYYDSFDYTRTGHNYCHPRTVGLLSRLCSSIPKVQAVDFDFRFNLGNRVKFQPDLVAVDAHEQALVIIDFESPNSSDARIPEKDVRPYVTWVEAQYNTISPAYFVITSLPRNPQSWELRWTSRGQWNEAKTHHDAREKIKRSPFTYWYPFYRKELRQLAKEQTALKSLPIHFVNLDGARAELVDIW